MDFASVILLTFNFLFIGLTPVYFFRKDGSFNLMWFVTGLPLFLWPVSVYGVFWGYLDPWLGAQSEWFRSLSTFGVLLCCSSIAFMALTLGTHRIPLSLWHQDNDAPRSIVTWGAYRFIRHPFYTSFIVAHLGCLLLVTHWFQLLLLAYQVVILNITAAREEKRLQVSEFGDEYKAYMSHTGRFFPKFQASRMLESLLVWVTEYRHLVLGMLIAVTVIFSLFLFRMGINATPYFISADHPVRVTEQQIKGLFTNTEEQAFVALVDEQNGVFTRANLELIQSLTRQLDTIVLADEGDLETLRALAAGSEHSRALVEQIADNGLGVEDYDGVKQLLASGVAAEQFSPRQLEKLQEILVQVRPVKRVRSLFTVEDIKADGDDLQIEPLLQEIPTNDAGLVELKEYVLNNPLLTGVIVSADGLASNLQVELHIAEDDAPNMQAMYAAIAELVDRVKADQPELQGSLHFSGPPMVTAQIAETIQMDNMKFFPLVTTVIGIILFFSFRRFQGVALPLVVSSLSTLWTLGLMAIFGVDINIVTASLPVFLMTIAVADSIHYLTDYYHQLEQHDPLESVKLSLRRLMTPLLMTSVTTFFGFLALASTNLIFVQQFALFVAAGVIFAFIITITLLPALLPLMKQPGTQASKAKNSPLHGIDRLFSRIYHGLSKAPLVIIVFTVALIAGCGYLIRDLAVDNENVASFGADTRIRMDDAVLNRHFGGTVPINVWFSAEDERRFTQPDVVAAMDKIGQRFMQHDIIGYVGSPSNLVKRINQVLNDVDYGLPEDMSAELIAQYYLLYENGSGQEIRDTLDMNYENARMVALSHTDQSSKMRTVVQDVNAYAQTVLPADVTMQVAGFGQIMVVSTDEIVNGQLSSLIAATLLVTAVMMFLFRSLLVAVLGVVPLTLSILINFATMELSGIAVDIGTALIAGIVFGIGVDYAIHFLATLQRNTAAGLSLEQAIRQTVSSVSRPIVVNSVSMTLGFCVLMSSSYAVTSRLGMLIAITMTLCALLTLLILPILIQFFKPKALRSD
ncbi:MAG: MMPL family transporter [Pseudomonadota bacterium]|nr:MMPL family transporter [Pseudomonadota bacterium]